MRIVQAWNRFWFDPVSVRRLATARLIIVAVVVFDLLADPNGSRRLARTGGEAFWNPDALVVVRELHLPRTPDTAWTILWVLLTVCALLALVGLVTRAALAVLALGYAWWVMTSLSYGFVGHGRLISVVALLALAIAPSGRAFSLDAVIRRAKSAQPGQLLPRAQDEQDALACWALRFIGVVLVLAYTSAAYTKIRNSGLDWAFDGAMDAALIEQGTWLADIAADYPAIVHLMALAALGWEASAFLLFVGGRARDAWVLFGVGFHLGSLLLLEVNFIDYPAAYVVFYRLEDLAAFASRHVRVWAERFDTVEVVYDGQCGLCVKAVTFLEGIDWLGLLRPLDGTAADGSRLQVFEAREGDDVYEGFRAYRRIARSVPLLLPIWPLLYVPGVPQVGERVYQRVAASRGMSCSITACAIPVLGEHSSGASDRLQT